MKVKIKRAVDKETEDIFIRGNLVESIESDGSDSIYVLITGYGRAQPCFAGVRIDGHYCDTWAKDVFRLFKGEIILTQ